MIDLYNDRIDAMKARERTYPHNVVATYRPEQQRMSIARNAERLAVYHARDAAFWSSL